MVDKSKPSTDKNNYKYKIMIRQPDFLTSDLFDRFVLETKKKKKNVFLEKLYLDETEEGLCCQMLHKGSYDDEPYSFKMMDDFCNENGYIRACQTHREIYLSDPRKTDAAKLKTILRYKISQK